jgi:hypothetical protein
VSRRSLMNMLVRSTAAVAVAGSAAIASPLSDQPAEAQIATDHTDAELLALGERLKVVSAQAKKLEPDWRLHQSAMDASGFMNIESEGERNAAIKRFKSILDENRYSEACVKWNAVCSVEHRIAREILRTPSTTRVGDGVRAAAALVEDASEPENEAAEVLWEMAARAGFPVPAEFRKVLKRRGVVTKAKKQKLDPIFAAIEKHRAAWSEFNSRCSALDTAATPQAEAELYRLRQAGDSSIKLLIGTKPTSRDGVIALARYAAELVGQDYQSDFIYPREDSRKDYVQCLILSTATLRMRSNTLAHSRSCSVGAGPACACPALSHVPFNFIIRALSST